MGNRVMAAKRLKMKKMRRAWVATPLGQAKYELELGNAMRFRGPGPCNNYEESWIYFNSSRSAFFILHLDKKIGIQRKSISYSCKEILITKWNMGKVTWVEIEDLPALT